MVQKILGDLVDLGLHLFELGGEFCNWGGAPDQFFPPALFAVQVQFRNGKSADRCHHIAQ